MEDPTKGNNKEDLLRDIDGGSGEEKTPSPGDNLERQDLVLRIEMMRDIYSRYIVSKKQLIEWSGVFGEEEVKEYFKSFDKINDYVGPPSDRANPEDFSYKKMISLAGGAYNFSQSLGRPPFLLKESNLNGLFNSYKRWFKSLDNPKVDAFPSSSDLDGFYFLDPEGRGYNKYKIIPGKEEEVRRRENCLAESLLHSWSQRLPDIDFGLEHRFTLELLRYPDLRNSGDVDLFGVDPQKVGIPSIEEYQDLIKLKADFHHGVVETYLSLWEEATREGVEPNDYFKIKRLRLIIMAQAIYAENFGLPVKDAKDRFKELISKTKWVR